MFWFPKSWIFCILLATDHQNQGPPQKSTHLISQEGQVDQVDQVVQDRQADPLARSLDDQGFLFLPWVLEYQEILGGLHRLQN